MDGAWLHRMRWRRRGAWLWPAFIAAIFLDAVVGHALPPSGLTQSVVAAGLLACVLNLIGVVLLSRPLGALLRRARPDLPGVVARDYGGTVVVVSIAAVLLVAGIINHPSVVSARRAMQDAIARAQAWIGDRAPSEFRRNLETVSTLTIEPGSIYRVCVPSKDRRKSYCVVVERQLPLARSVSFAGYEPNSVLGEGTG